MSDYATALQALRDARDALNAVDLRAAEAALVAHDEALRAACAGSQPPAVSELESLAAGHQELLSTLAKVQNGVARELTQAKKGAAAARAYLGATGE